MRIRLKFISIVTAAGLLAVSVHVLAQSEHQAGPVEVPVEMDAQLYMFFKSRQKRLKNLKNFVERVESVEFDPEGPGGGGCVSAANCVVFNVYSRTIQGSNERLRISHRLSYLEVAAEYDISLPADTLDALGTGFVGFQYGFNKGTTGKADPTGKLETVFKYMFEDDQTDEEKEALQARMGSEEPWLDPFSMIGAGGFMISDTAGALRDAEESVRKGADTAADDVRKEEDLFSRLEPRGRVEYNGVMAARYQTTAPPAPIGEVEGMQVVFNKADLYLDLDRNLAIGHRFDGTIIENGESRDFFIQVKNSDFRNPPGCYDLVKPYKRVMEMGGMLNDEQMAEMKQAQKQLADFDKQMAALPAAERQMMERMMGGQMETMRNMAESGALSYTMEIKEILCNADIKALFSTPMTGAGILQPSGEGLLQEIQVNLTKLGYEPGNTDGVLDTMTQVAISQFQAEAGLPVTGEPSQELAKALASAVAEL